MNIVYYVDDFPKLSESFILNEIYELSQLGHNVAVCALQKPECKIEHNEFDELNVPISYVKTPTYKDITQLLSKKVWNLQMFKDSFYYASPLDHAANFFRAKQCIEFVDSLKWDPEHFHSHFATISKFGALYASNYYNEPFTITTHAYDLYKEPIGTYTKQLLQQSDRIVTISEYNKRYIQDRFTSNTPIDVIHAGIRPEKFASTQSSQQNRVLTISRFVEKKGLPYALEAVEMVSDEIPELEYHIIGSGEMEDELIRKVEQLGIGENVDFLNKVTDQRLIIELDEARCYLLPCIIPNSGDRDGIPVSLMEAMAMKTPPVSTSISGIPELVDHGQNGLLTEPENAEALADALLKLLQDEFKWNAYAESASRKITREFNIKKEVCKLENTFQATQTLK
ncbi:glycosyltransferase [Halorarum salinum]|uniref:Glycosyltransferase n=1 Tax=Halorarum salinum TaxID=2743089 RepID=A0A7D5QFE2_9EURY|nr:glycosyltransferase [Halobaculum salinum]QLG63401.1 glycosyltransferase [Halobaculum salinum]